MTLTVSVYACRCGGASTGLGQPFAKTPKPNGIFIITRVTEGSFACLLCPSCRPRATLAVPPPAALRPKAHTQCQCFLEGRNIEPRAIRIPISSLSLSLSRLLLDGGTHPPYYCSTPHMPFRTCCFCFPATMHDRRTMHAATLTLNTGTGTAVVNMAS